MTPEQQKLIRMALEIRQNFNRRGGLEPAVEHIRAFWAPSMRADFVALAGDMAFPEDARPIAAALAEDTA